MIRTHARCTAAGRRLAAVVTGTALAVVLAVPATATPAYAAPAATAPAATAAARPAAARIRASMAGAVASARTLQRPVVIPALTTETSQVAADPAGDLTMTANVLPVRVRAGGGWRPVSATLRRGLAGTWSPAATPSQLVLSGGGTGPIAVLTSADGSRLALSFPGRLPAPVIAGATATYLNVLPGVSLQLTASTLGGVSQTLIVSSAAAAASLSVHRLRIALAGRGLQVAASAGNLSVTGPRGQAEFSGPAPVAWDSAAAGSARRSPAAPAAPAKGAGPVNSTDRATAAGPGAGSRAALASATVTAGALTIVAPAAILSPAAHYPAYLADSITPDAVGVSGCGNQASCFGQKSAQNGYTEVKAGCPTQSGWNNSDPYGSGAGNQDYPGSCDGAYRAYYQLGMSGLTALSAYGTVDVQSATFTANENYGSDFGCADKWPLALHLTDAISSGTHWSNKPANGANDQPSTQMLKPGPNPSSGCATQSVQFDVTYAMALAVSAGWIKATFGLYGDEAGSGDPEDGPSNACTGGDSSGGLSSAGYNCGFMRIGDDPSIITTIDITPPAPTCTNQNSTSHDGSAGSCDTQVLPIPQDSPGKIDFGCNDTGTGWIDQDTDQLDVTMQAAITGEKVSAIDHMWDNSSSGSPEVSGFPLQSNYYPTSGTNNVTSQTSTGLPSGVVLQNGHQYGWYVQATVNGDGGDTSRSAPYSSAPSMHCRFNVDTAPPAGLAVTSTQFPASGSGQAGQDAGSTGTFSFSAADPVPGGCASACLASGVYQFTYTLNAGATQHASAPAPSSPGATVSVPVQIPVGDWGTNVLQVTAQDNAGNISPTLDYTFYAPWNPSTRVVAGDVNGDAVPDLLATTGSSLLLYPGDGDPAAALQSGAGCITSTGGRYAGPCVAGPQSGSPDGTAWSTFQVTHRGSVSQAGVDDLYAHKGGNLFLVLNNPASKGTAPQYSSANTSSITTIASHPGCAATADNAANCSGYTTGNWSDVTQILAPGDAWTGVAGDNGQPSLLTVENGELWLYRGLFGNALGSPIELGSAAGTTNWSGMTLIAPGKVGSQLTIWARDNATGALYSYPVTIDANGLPTFDPASPQSPVAATSGAVITGITLTAAAYAAVASAGPLDNSSFPGLYAETTTGVSPAGASCATGCLYYYPGQSTSGGSQPLTTTPVFVGILSTPAAQLS